MSKNILLVWADVIVNKKTLTTMVIIESDVFSGAKIQISEAKSYNALRKMVCTNNVCHKYRLLAGNCYPYAIC